VWEWTRDVSKNGIYKDQTLPESGHVALVDPDGVVLKTSSLPNASFGDDYASISREGTRGFLRGGFYGSGEDGGIFAQNIAAPLDLATIGVGFRCVRDI
jgi:formylglycine-generating enzyme required for sulfatase activity